MNLTGKIKEKWKKEGGFRETWIKRRGGREGTRDMDLEWEKREHGFFRKANEGVME
jgi:hypothetical protein